MNIITYCDYKTFYNKTFGERLINCLNTAKNVSYHELENSFLHTLDKMAPTKQKYIRGNQSPRRKKTFLRL